MTSRRSFSRDNMYGSRPSRPNEPREGITLPNMNSMPRRHNVFGADERVSRGKAIDEDRLGRDLRMAGFLTKPRGVDRADRADAGSSYGRSLGDDRVMKMVRTEEATRYEKGVEPRLREGGSRGERTAYRSYGEEPKWVRGAKYEGLSNYDGVGSLRGSDYTAGAGSSTEILPGFIFESHKRMILDWFRKGTFGLLFEDRRLAEQVGPGTKVFLFDGTSRELYGVFQAVTYATIAVEAEVARVTEGTSLQVRVRIVKECLPVLERDFKDYIHENYYTNSKFTAGLSKDQVSKLLQCFRAVDVGRNLHLSLTSSRSTLHSGLSQDFHGDEFSYGKEERRRISALEIRSFSSHSYHGQDAGRFSSKLPLQAHSSKGWTGEVEDYEGDEVLASMPIDSSAMVASGLQYSSRGKQQSLRGLSGARGAGAHHLGTVRHSDVKLGEGDWREEDARGLTFRGKRHPLSSNSLDDLKRRDRSPSPAWKEVRHSFEAAVSEVYEGAGKGSYKEESSYMASTRHLRNDIDLNLPLDIGHGEPSSMHDVEPKVLRRRVWEEEDDKGYSGSPSKGRALHSHALSLRGHDNLLAPNSQDDYEDMTPSPQKDLSLLRLQDKRRSVLTGNLGKLRPRALSGVKNHGRDKPGLASLLRKKAVPRREVYTTKDFPGRNPNAPVFKLKSNLQAPGKGKAERLATLLSTAKPRLRFDGAEDKDGFHPWRGPNSDAGEGSIGRKRKASVWSRLNIPGKVVGKKSASVHGKGRVFSRLGPTWNTSPDGRESNYVPKKEKTQPHQGGTSLTWIRKVEDPAVGTNQEVHEELSDGDYVHGNDDLGGSVMESLDPGTEALQGWSRKKQQLVSASSGDEAVNPDHVEVGKGGRRKLVRPPIGGKIDFSESGAQPSFGISEVNRDCHSRSVDLLATSSEANAHGHQGSHGVLIDTDIGARNPQETHGGYSQISRVSNAMGIDRLRNLNSPPVDFPSDNDGDNMMS